MKKEGDELSGLLCLSIATGEVKLLDSGPRTAWVLSLGEAGSRNLVRQPDLCIVFVAV